VSLPPRRRIRRRIHTDRLMERVGPSAWRAPVEWCWLSLRLPTGERELHKVKGDIDAARIVASSAMTTGRYESATYGELPPRRIRKKAA